MSYLAGTATPEIDQLIFSRLQRAGLAWTSAELPGFNEAHQAGLTVISQENWLAFHNIINAPNLAPDVAQRIRAGAEIGPQQRQAAERVRQQFSAAVDAQLAKTPLIVLPTLPECPPTLEEAADPLKVVNLTRLVRPFNLSGHPALSLPLGEINHRPVALQLVANKNKEFDLLNYAEYLLGKLK